MRKMKCEKKHAIRHLFSQLIELIYLNIFILKYIPKNIKIFANINYLYLIFQLFHTKKIYRYTRFRSLNNIITIEVICTSMLIKLFKLF